MLRLSSRNQRIVAAIVVSAITLAVIGAVAVSTTSLGCGPGNALHINMARCHRVASTDTLPTPTSSLTAPSASPTTSATGASPVPTASNNPSSGPSAINPFNGPGSTGPFFGPASQNPFACAQSCFGAPVGGLALTCRLPISAVQYPGNGGFVAFPGGTYVADPRSNVTAPSPGPGALSQAVPQVGGPPYGWWGLTYDRAYSKWLPVPRAWVSPDGKRYAYPGVSDGVYVASVSSATTTKLGAGKAWSVIDVEAAGVYAAPINAVGLWLLPFSGAPKQIIGTGFWVAAAGNFAYGFSTSSPTNVANTVLRLNLSSGGTSDWFTRPGGQSNLLGFDAKGNPVIEVNTSAPSLEIWISVAPNSGYLIASIYGYFGSDFFPSSPPVGDSHGLWFAANQGIAIYIPSSGAWYWESGVQGAQLAGGCS